MKNMLKKAWKLYCEWFKMFVSPIYGTCYDLPFFEFCFRGFLFNVMLLGMVFTAFMLVLGICVALYHEPFITSCVLSIVLLFGVVLPLLVHKTSR